MTTDNLASLPEAEVDALLAERVSVECPGCVDCLAVDGPRAKFGCQGSGRRWLLRSGECEYCQEVPADKTPCQHTHERGDDFVPMRLCWFNHNKIARHGCGDCSGFGYVYSGDYDGLRAAIEAKGWTAKVTINPSPAAMVPDVGMMFDDGGDMLSWVYTEDDLRGLRFWKVLVLRAVEGQDANA